MKEQEDGEHPAYVMPSQVLRSDVDGQMVLLDLASETYYGLDEVGAHMVTLLLERPFEDAVVNLVDIYDSDPAVLRRDLDALVEQLVSAGLLERAGDGGPG